MEGKSVKRKKEERQKERTEDLKLKGKSSPELP